MSVVLAIRQIILNRTPAGSAITPISAMPLQNTQQEASLLMREGRFLQGMIAVTQGGEGVTVMERLFSTEASIICSPAHR